MLFERFRRHRRVRECIRVLGPLLIARYGAAESYSLGQLRTALGLEGFEGWMLPFAAAMFAASRDFVEWVRSDGDAVVPSGTVPPWVRATLWDKRADPAALRDELRRDAAHANGASLRFLPAPVDPYESARTMSPLRNGQASPGDDFRWYR